ncbi:outer membrane protein [Devosia aurantiaca]|uniref:Porin family protein n=1 Tax=Devosia aurantiaca TaxID=2714858 RepID=A0A6M1T3F8_9HYPH|nr:outer membrane beta-barrel protein [Devosia aurantiaca]NGP19351.1 porin family protein [Devosia aurantiaca]
MRLVLVLAAMGALAAPAAGVEIKPAPAGKMTDAGFDWTGFYAGLNGGTVAGHARAVSNTTIMITDTPVNGYVLGATLGANWQLQQFVLGAEGDLAWAGASGTALCTVVPANNCDTDLSWLGTIKARAGVAFDRTLLFANGGFVTAGASMRVSPAVAGTSGVFEERYSGWTVGVGAEVSITKAVSVKAEYNLNEFSEKLAPVDSLRDGEVTSVRPVLHTVKVGANWHF